MRVQSYYRLELRWLSLVKERANRVFLRGAYFTGPVLKHARAIDPGDSMVLDLTPQYAKVLTHYYFVTLGWGDVDYTDSKVVLHNAFLSGEMVNEISQLTASDYILIDTSKHEEKDHMFNLVYRSAVMTRDSKEHVGG